MDVGVNVASPFSQRVLTLTRPWPGVTVQAADCGGGAALVFAGCQVAHLHGGDEAELLLGHRSAARLGPLLAGSGRAWVDGRTVRLRLGGESDVRTLLSLLSLAMKTCADDGCRGNAPWCRIGRGAAVC
ncbi:luciferase family protein [Actinocorallia populi]|uniref:luciferase family protein n=1 Tax=Actinocorallia populi TaxID=2079200 RepID=UPI000D087D4E|nr:luciferase family protein [Actinocorallia populi]